MSGASHISFVPVEKNLKQLNKKYFSIKQLNIS